MPGQDVQAPGAQGGCEGLGVGDPEGVVVHGLGLLHLEIVAGVGRGGLGVHHHLVGEQDVLGGEGGAVVPLDAAAQLKGNGEAVRGDLPALGQVAHLVEVAVILHQAVVDQAELMLAEAASEARGGKRVLASPMEASMNRSP